jgi:Xaa-Pro aminopeptidase
MGFDRTAIQKALDEDGLDGWLLYDFHGSNSIARRIAGLTSSAKLTTRRWYYLVPASGQPRALVHRIEQDTLAHLPGERRIYSGRAELDSGLAELVRGLRRVAMEYSPACAIPYLSRVDAGTVERIRSLGVEVVSSGDLVQRFEAAWDRTALETHRAASRHLHTIKDRAFEFIRSRVAGGTPTEYEVQQEMVEWFREAGLVTDCPPVVAAQQSSGNPHYLPTAADHRPIRPGQIVLLDLWGKLDRPGAVYADITWVGFTGATVPAKAATVFGAARRARDAAIALVSDRVRAEQPIYGWEVDRAAREVIEAAGYGDRFVHRTGHSLGEEVHGNGVHMDDYETRDDRRLIAGTGFTIEPGIYLDDFGVRTEINMHVGTVEAAVTGPLQTEIVPLG